MDLADEFTQQCRMRVGALLGDGVRLDALIGLGGMAAVYAATSPYGEPCAVKILHPDVAALGEARARFLQEAEIAKSLAHPGIVKIHTVGADGDDVFIVMDLLVGETVDGRAERAGGRLPIDEVLWIADETLGVLAVAHAQGIVHRDLKPENLFLTKRNELKVLDFGIARAAEMSGARSAAMTRTGIAMGTPAFMAPEQALGRWADVDGRTDLWALGATMFTLLTGELVHEGETANEMIVSAATSPARSLARLLPDAPVGLVQLVDQALSYDKQGRFESAIEMRRHLRGTRRAASVPSEPPRAAAVPSEPPRAPSVPPADRSARHAPVEVAATMPLGLASPPVAAPELPREASKATAPLGGRGGRGGGGGDALVMRGFERLDVTQVSVDERAQLRELFIAMDRAFVARVQYGPDHAETKRRFERVTTTARVALENARQGLVWQISPYSFHIEGESLWEPEAPHDRVPYALFSAGVRELALLRGLEGDEVSELLRILTLDPVVEISPEDDLATLLWDACFQHILVHSIDSFVDGDQAARAAHERQIQGVIDEARSDDRGVMEASHRAEASGRGGGVEGLQRLVGVVAAGGGQELTAEAVARAQGLVQRVTHRGAVEPGPRDVLPIEDATRKVLALRLSGDPQEVGERFVVAAARAVANADAKGAAEPLLAALAVAVEGLLETAPAQALAFVAALCQSLPGAPEKKEPLARRIASATLTEASMQRVLKVLAGPDGEAVAAAFAPLMPRLAGAHVGLVIDALIGASEGAARVVLLEYVRLFLAGYEARVANLFPKVDVDLGLALVRTLADQGSPASKEAILRATESPHPVVRIEALGHVEGQSSERLRQEMRALLDDADKSVRVAALTAMAQHKIKAAGPFLAMRIKGASFDALDGEERRLALETVAILTAARAEALAMELLEPGTVFKNEAREGTRLIAAEMLGRIGSSEDAKRVLERVAGQRLLASKGVREAAALALKHLEERDAATKGKAP